MATPREAALQFCRELGLDPQEEVFEKAGAVWARQARVDVLEARFARQAAELRAVLSIIQI
jgi:hypothetical protein